MSAPSIRLFRPLRTAYRVLSESAGPSRPPLPRNGAATVPGARSLTLPALTAAARPRGPEPARGRADGVLAPSSPDARGFAHLAGGIRESVSEQRGTALLQPTRGAFSPESVTVTSFRGSARRKDVAGAATGVSQTRFFRVSPLQSGASAPPTAPDSPLPISTLPPPVPASSRPIQPTLKDKLNVEPEFVPLPTDPEAYQIWLGEWKSMRKKEARLASAQGQKSGMESTLKVVAIAMAGNLVMFIVKAYTAYTSGSSSMVSEALHSLADSLNQCLLAYGIYRSMQAPDPLHPYGFQSERFAWALVSGVGIFFLGGGVSIQHGIHGLMHPEAIGAVGTAIGVLAANFAVDSYSLHTAWNEVKEKAVEQGMKPLEYVTKGVDPTTTAVFYEDLAALGGVVIALSCIGLSHVTGNPFYDSAGSIAIGAILAWVAVRLIRQNVNGLVGTSMNPQKLNAIVSALKKDPVVLSVHDVKSITRGSNWARFKAEINFDGAQVVRRYRERLAASDLPPEALAGMSFDFLMKGQGLQSEADASKWLEAHGRGILEQVGLEIDRLEKIVFDIAPEVKHVDIEVL